VTVNCVSCFDSVVDPTEWLFFRCASGLHQRYRENAYDIGEWPLMNQPTQGTTFYRLMWFEYQAILLCISISVLMSKDMLLRRNNEHEWWRHASFMQQGSLDNTSVLNMIHRWANITDTLTCSLCSTLLCIYDGNMLLKCEDSCCYASINSIGTSV
jgi:hypothetical protein